MGIDRTSSSPELQRVLMTCGAESTSFYKARDMVWTTRRLELKPKEIERVCHRGGQERDAERQELVRRFEALPLAEKEAAPPELSLIPDVVAVEPDGGRYQQRIWDEATPSPSPSSESADSPAEAESPASGPGEVAESAGLRVAAVEETDTPHSAPAAERKGCWREDKNAVLLRLNSEVHASDPAPLIPEGFLDITAMGQLAQEIKNARQPEPGGTFGEETAEEESADEERISAAATYAHHRPEITAKQVVATTRNASAFGALVAAQAWVLGFFAARRRAFLGDGLRMNWTLWRTRFPTFVPILDFIHGLTYIYPAAFAGQSREAGTATYRVWIQWAWSGRTTELIAAVAQRLSELPPVSPGDTTSPQAVVAAALRYLRNNASRMNYPEYRRQGLPITTSLIESTVKQINYRMKGTEKFWSGSGAEALLQLRADVLSEIDTLDDFFARREKNVQGIRPYRPKSAAAA